MFTCLVSIKIVKTRCFCNVYYLLKIQNIFYFVHMLGFLGKTVRQVP